LQKNEEETFENNKKVIFFSFEVLIP
jgi:hypothetical protein